MTSGFIVRFRPSGPWRLGPPSGARDRVDRVLHSDTLYSALTLAALDLGILREWLAATAESAEPAVRAGSLFPFAGRTLLAPAPRHVWPPASSAKVLWESARLVPLQIIPRLLAYETLKEDRWALDPVSECVLPIEKFGEVTSPFRVALRRTAAVDRASGVSAGAASTACLEFSENAGMWCPVFCAPEWRERTESLFRFVADHGLGGERSLGWGRSLTLEFESLPSALTAEITATEGHQTGYWLLSLYAPASGDSVDWTRGSYRLLRRSGRIAGLGELKIESAMAEEGSVLVADAPPAGRARDIAPEGADHPVYRAGFAVAVPVAVRLPGFQGLQRQPIPAESEPVAEQMVAAGHEAFEHPPAIPSMPGEDGALETPPLEQESEQAGGIAEPTLLESEPVAEQIPPKDSEAARGEPNAPSLPGEDGGPEEPQ